MNHIEAIIGGHFGVFVKEIDIEKVARYIKVHPPVTESRVIGDGHTGDLVFPAKTHELHKGIVSIAQTVFIGIFEGDFVSLEDEFISFGWKFGVGLGLLLFKFGVTTARRYLYVLRRGNDARVERIIIGFGDLNACARRVFSGRNDLHRCILRRGDAGRDGHRPENRTEKNRKETPHLAKIGL